MSVQQSKAQGDERHQVSEGIAGQLSRQINYRPVHEGTPDRGRIYQIQQQLGLCK